MAVTITRSVWIDDDGTGTTGTVINQALHTTLYNEIDTALAKVAQLAGGNTFTGTQNVSGVLATTTIYVNTASGYSAQVNVAVNQALTAYAVVIQNTNTGNLQFLYMINSSGVPVGSITQSGASVVYNTTSDARLKDDAGRAADVSALRALVVHDFTWKADGVRARGVFAQEAAAVFPHAITPGTDETTADGQLARPWMTDYSKLVPDLIVGWQQHDADLAELRAILAAVKG